MKIGKSQKSNIKHQRNKNWKKKVKYMILKSALENLQKG